MTKQCYAFSAAIMLLSLIAAPLEAQQEEISSGLATLRAAEQALTTLIESAEPSVVAITQKSTRQASTQPRLFRQADENLFRELRGLPTDASAEPPTGAGVVIDPSGLVLTQYLVVTPGRQHYITTVDGNSFPAEIRAADPRSGLAVLAVVSEEPVTLPALRIGQAEMLRKGTSVVAIGNPQALLADGQPTASHGSITNLSRKADPQVNLNNTRDERQDNYRTTLHHFGSLIQSDARLGWNASGGALINLNGELIGITTTVSVIPGHEQPAGYAIPLNASMRRVVNTLKEGKEVEYGMLGISFSVTSPSNSTSRVAGIAIQTAYPGSPAGRAGLMSSDIITRINGQPTPDADRLQLLVGQESPGTKLTVSYERAGQTRQAVVELSKHYTIGEKVVTTPRPRWRGMLIDYSTAVSQSLLVQATIDRLIDPAGCVVVAAVTPDSISWQQGVRPGMFISHVSGDRVSNPKEFWEAVENAKDSVKIRFTQPEADR